jgi:ABC-2 type transport system permease protein
MSTLTPALLDSATMLRRRLRHMRRYPSMTLMLVVMPVVFLLLFVYVFGGTLGAGLGGLHAGRAEYVNFVTPGIILFTVAGAGTGTAVSVASDMTEGIVARFRTMAISRSSVLAGHVAGSVIQTMLSMAIIIGVALLAGFRPTAGPAGWAAAAGVLVLLSLGITWLSVALGLFSRSPESASNAPMPLLVLPFLGSGFVPTSSMPQGLRWFAEYQPFTPVIDAVRALLLGTPAGDSVLVACAWGAGITVAGYAWSRRLYRRDPLPGR